MQRSLLSGKVTPSSLETMQLLKPLLADQISSILIKGEPGTGKTTLAFELLSMYGKGIYVSTRVSEERSAQHNPILASLYKSGKIFEVNEPKEHLKGQEKYSFDDQRFSDPQNLLSALIAGVDRISEPMLILDSWDAIANRTERIERLKTEQTLEFLSSSRKAKLVFLSEEPTMTTTDYLVDAVVTLKNSIYEGRRIRSMEWNKLRGSPIQHWTSLYTLDEGRFTIFPRESTSWTAQSMPKPFRSMPHKEDYYSTGSEDLDAFLGGGLRKGSQILFEFGKNVSSSSFNYTSTMIRCNFLANNGCTLTIPSPGVTANRIKESVSRYLPEPTVESSLRLGYFDVYDSDACFFALDRTSSSKSLDLVMEVAEKIKGRENRPCLFSYGAETLSNEYCEEDAFRFAESLGQRSRHFGDVVFVVSRFESPLLRDLSSIVDVHVKLDEIDGTLVIHCMKPWSQLFHVNNDHSLGYPHVRLVPIV